MSQVDRLSDSEKDSLWLYSRLQYQNKMLDKSSKLCEPNGGSGGSSATLSLSDDLTLKIDRVKAAEISVEHFQVRKLLLLILKAQNAIRVLTVNCR